MMKIVAEFVFEYEAEIAKGRLESEGIEAMISNVNTPYPGLQLGKHGVQLLVNDYDFESAQMILDAAADEPAPDEPALDEPAPDEPALDEA